jgi:Spy/CpxP family protein refolding chaperone
MHNNRAIRDLCFEFVETTATFIKVTFIGTTALFVKATFVVTTATFVKTMSLRSRDEREPALHSGAFGDHKSANSEKKKIEKMRKLFFFYRGHSRQQFNSQKNNEDVL